MLREDLRLKQLYTSLSLRFQTSVTQFVSDIGFLYETVPSTSAFETYGWLTSVPRMRKWVGPRAFKSLSTRAYTIQNEPFELSVRVKESQIKDGRIADVQMITTMMGREAGATPDRLMIDLLKNGHLSSATAFDGQNFFDTDHMLGDSGVQSNYYASGKPLTAENYGIVRSAMMSLKSESGDPIGVRPDRLIVPPALEGAGNDIIVPPPLATATQYRGTAQVVVVPELAGQDTSWYLADSRFPLKPLILQTREAPRYVARTTKDDEPVFMFGECEFGADARWGAGYAGWMAITKAAA